MSLVLIPIQTTIVTEHSLFIGQGYSEKQNQQYAQVEMSIEETNSHNSKDSKSQICRSSHRLETQTGILCYNPEKCYHWKPQCPLKALSSLDEVNIMKGSLLSLESVSFK